MLDFGLAKITEPVGDAAEHATLTFEGTTPGVIMGTAPYMSPEQARGQSVDKRTDIWAFGCVLYEMLTGRAAFAGATISDVMVAILERKPDWSLVPPSTDPTTARLLRRCLTKDLKRRWRDIGEASAAIDEAISSPVESDDAAAPDRLDRPMSSNVKSRWWRVAAAALLVLVAAVTIWSWSTKRDASSVQTVIRTTVTLPTNQLLDAQQSTSPLAMSADGHQLAYAGTADGVTKLYVRSLDTFEAKR